MDTITYLKARGYVTADGKLEAQLPAGVTVGEVDLMVALRETHQSNGVHEDNPMTSEPMFTEEELIEMLTPNPVPAEQIIGGGWEDMDITDSVEWVNKLRRQEEERRQQTWQS